MKPSMYFTTEKARNSTRKKKHQTFRWDSVVGFEMEFHLGWTDRICGQRLG